MKKEYDTPKAEKLEFDYTSTVVASNGGKSKPFCVVHSSTAYYEDGNGHQYSQTQPGDE